MNSRLAVKVARKGLTTRRAYEAQQNRAENVVLILCAALIIICAALGWLVSGN